MPLLETLPSWQLFVDWNRDGFSGVLTEWALGDDISAYVKNLEVEVGQTDPNSLIGEINALSCVLDNSKQLFSPGPGVSPLVGKLLPRLPVFLIAVDGGTQERLFYGFIETIDPTSGDRDTLECTITAVGAMQILQDTKLDFPLILNQTSDQLIRHIINYAFGAAFAETRLDFIGRPTAGDTFTFNGTVYTFVNTLTPLSGEVVIGPTRYDSLENLGAVINGESSGVAAYAPSSPQPALIEADRSASYYQLNKDHGAVRYYRLGEPSGTTIFDLGTNLYNAVASAVTLNQNGALSGDTDTAALFNGSTSYIDCGPLDIGLGSFSLECWIKPASLAAVGCAISITGTGGTRPSANVFINTNGSLEFNWFSEVVTSAAAAVAVGNWYHVLMTYDSVTDTSKIYLNGVLIASGNAGPFGGGDLPTMRIGCTSPGFGQFNGTIDEVAVYFKAINATTAAAKYAAAIIPPGLRIISVLPGAYGNKLPLQKNSLTLRAGAAIEAFNDKVDRYYRLGETAGTTAFDATTNRQNGTHAAGVTVNQPGGLNRDNDPSARYNGSTGYTAIPSYNFVNRSFTITLWAKPETGVSPMNLFSAFDSFAAGKTFYIRMYSTGAIEVSFFGSGLTTPAGVFQFNTWNYVAVAYDYPTLTVYVYVNGLLVASAGSIGPFTAPAPTVQIGALTAIAEYYKGWLDEVEIYPSTLSAARQFAHYAQGVTYTLKGAADALNGWIDTPYAEVVKADGAGVYWRFDGTSNAGPFVDLIGYQYATVGGGTPGVLARGPLMGDPNPAMFFDGYDDWLVLPPPPISGRDFTYELWIFPCALPASTAFILNVYGGAGANNSFNIILNTNGSITVDYTADSLSSAAGSILINTWYHLMIVRNHGADTTTLYINGTAVASNNAGGMIVAATNVGLGASYTGASNYCGLIDDLAIYYKALTAPQALNHWQTSQNKYATYLVNLEPGTIINYAGDTWQNGQTDGLSAIEQILETERGWFYEDRGGVLTFLNQGDRYYRAALTPDASLDNNVKIKGGIDVKQIYNHVVAEITPRAALTTGVIAKASSTLTIPGGKSITVRLNFVDPETGSPMSATSVLLPTPGTDWQAGENQPGDNNGYYNSYQWLKFSYSIKSTYLDLTIKNLATGTLRVFALQFLGAGLVRYNPIGIARDDYDSIARYGTRSKSLRFPLTTDFTFAESYTYDLIKQLSTPSYRAAQVDFEGMRRVNNISVYRFKIARLLELSNAQIGVSRLRHEVIGAHYSLGVQRELQTQLNVRRVDDSAYLVLNSLDKSLLSGAYKIGV